MKCFAILIVFITAMMRISGLLQAAHYSMKAKANEKVVVVVGGGAAGYFSAVECARSLQENKVPYKVVVLEAGRSVLNKVLISGGGRCNVMHNPDKGPGDIAKGYPRGSKELLGPLSTRFGPEDTHEWFTSRGVELKTERDGRVFPSSDRSTTITEALESAARSARVEVVTGAKVVAVQATQATQGTSINSPDEDKVKRFSVVYHTSSSTDTSSHAEKALKGRRSSLYEGLESVDEDLNTQITNIRLEESGAGQREKVVRSIECDRVILATGSSRLGYDMARSLGHAMLDPLPSLFSFKIPDPELTALSGLSAKYAKVRLLVPKPDKPDKAAVPVDAGLAEGACASRSGAKTKATPVDTTGFTQRGPLLLTRQGMSGPAVLKLSAFGARQMSASSYRFDVEVSWVGDLTAHQIGEHFATERRLHPNRLVSKCFPHLTEELFADIKEKMATASLQNLRRAEIGHNAFVRAEDTNEEQPNLSIYDTPTHVTASLEEEDSNVIPRRLWVYLLRRQGIELLKWSQLSPQAIQKLAVEVTKGVFRVEGRGMYRDEFVTCGGVALKEVRFSSMESKVVPGLFLAGEVLNIDGITGGYNFQSAWTTGHIAGSNCADSLNDP